MTATVAALNLLLGAVYTQYGTMTIIDLKRNWRTLGFSHFGAAWIALAFTCGPHHLAHGYHLAFEGRPAGTLDLVAVLIGLPVGVAWFLLRVEAFRGGRGDRFVAGTPGWLILLPALAGAYLAALLAAGLRVGEPGLDYSWAVVPNLMLIAVYMTIGYFLFRTQFGNRGPLGGWSVSGLSLAVVFPTCALMHAVYALYAMTGRYDLDIHTYGIDWLGVPAGIYFLWVVHGLYVDALRDWNRASPELAGGPAPATATAGRTPAMVG